MYIRDIPSSVITQTVEKMVIDANYFLPVDVRLALEKAKSSEKSPVCINIIEDILLNAQIAEQKQIPICQDTGLAIFFIELGQDVHISGSTLQEAFDEGVALGYTRGYLRKSTQDNPIGERVNRNNNTPAICHIEMVPGDKITITVCPKGGGSENMSALGMLTPSQGRDGIKKFIVDTVIKAGGNPCPPIIVGCAVGGSAEKAMILAKKALIRNVGEPNPDPEIALLEKEILDEINASGIGAQGFGGTVTAMAVHMLTHPVHLASLPVAVNIQCHAARHITVTI